jgi:hypothetical protein
MKAIAIAALLLLLQQSPKEKTGLVPLCDMTAAQKYKGEDGGLYGEGKNDPPKAHAGAALAAAALVKPLDADGQPAAGGKIALVSIGMSNTTQEFSRFVQLARDKAATAVVLVDAAQGGQDAPKWTSADMRTWSVLDERLKTAGVTAKQVQVAWIKQAVAGPAKDGAFPAHAKKLQEHLAAIVKVARERFPNLRLVYLSSRIYAGNATGGLNPEPYAYEGAFAVRGLIQEQIKKPDAKAPVLLWGPYLWADGTAGRKDGLAWKPEDLGRDGTHPSDSGRLKVAELLLKFFQGDASSKGWFAK